MSRVVSVSGGRKRKRLFTIIRKRGYRQMTGLFYEYISEYWKSCFTLHSYGNSVQYSPKAIFWCIRTIEEGKRQKSKQRSSLLFGGRNCFNSLPHLVFSTQIIWRINTRRITATWQNGYFVKNGWSSGSHHSKPPPYQNFLFRSSLLLNS